MDMPISSESCSTARLVCDQRLCRPPTEAAHFQVTASLSPEYGLERSTRHRASVPGIGRCRGGRAVIFSVCRGASRTNGPRRVVIEGGHLAIAGLAVHGDGFMKRSVRVQGGRLVPELCRPDLQLTEQPPTNPRSAHAVAAALRSPSTSANRGVFPVSGMPTGVSCYWRATGGCIVDQGAADSN